MAANDERDGRAGAAALEGLRVLVVEDREIIASSVAQALHKAGCSVVGPAATLGAGLVLAKRGGDALDAAVLDIDLRGRAVYPLAEALRARGVPFLFLTGYGAPAIPDAWRGAPRVEKPFDAAAFLDLLARVAAAGPAPNDAPVAAADGPPAAEAGPDVWATVRRTRDLVTEGRVLCERAERITKRPGGGPASGQPPAASGSSSGSAMEQRTPSSANSKRVSQSSS